MRMMSLWVVLASSLVALSCSSFAAHATKANKVERVKPKFPLGCRAVGHQFVGQEMILRPVSETMSIQTVYLVHNLSNQNLQLKDPDAVGNDLTIPTYKTELEAGKWAAFSMNEKEIKFSCEKLHGRAPKGGQATDADQDADSNQDANKDQDAKIDLPTQHDQVANESVSCQESLEVCQYVRAKFGGHNGGSYWITKGGDQHQAVEDTIHSGILLR